MYYSKPKTNLPLKFKEGGNWMEAELASLGADLVHYQRWAKSYMQAVFNLNHAGTIGADVLPKPYDPEICQSGFAPRTTEQMNACLLASNWGRASIFADMGVGKTFIGGYAAMHWKKHSEQFQSNANKVTVVLCPKSVVTEWTTQPVEFFGSRVSVFPDNANWFHSDIIVTNYEQLGALMDYKELIGGVICDESQKIKNIDTRMFRNLCALLDNHVWHRMVMTGTAIKNKPDDLFTQLSIVNPFAFAFSHAMMMRTYFTAIKTMHGTMYKFKETWASMFRDITMRNAMVVEATAREAGNEVNVIAVSPTTDQNEYIAAVEKGTIEILRMEEDAVMRGYYGNTDAKGYTESVNVQLNNQTMKEQQISSGFMVAGEQVLRFRSSKMAQAYDLITAKHAGEQTIAWVYFRETAARLCEALNNAGVRSAIIYGGMSKVARDKIIKAFKEGRILNLVAQLQSANAGLNLQNCHINVFCEYPWAPSDLEQAMARTDRSGQKEKVIHYFLYTSGTADELFIAAQQTKTRVTSASIRKRAKKSVLSNVKVSPNRKKKSSDMQLEDTEFNWGGRDTPIKIRRSKAANLNI